MTVKQTYLYPAIFHFEDDGVGVAFPDLPGCYTNAKTSEEAMKMAKDALGLHLYGMEQDGDPIPPPSDPASIALQPGEAIVFVEIFMPLVRDMLEERAVKKTLTIPEWLNDLAEERGVNFSQVLQSGLKQCLGLSEARPRRRRTI
ncbi:MAG: type II toxin-antitoxin system HicB family antitoxin [Bacillota bacterium]|nr:type II toxin-antitoxin system HicB family antitoxin [Bacillota bacterium]